MQSYREPFQNRSRLLLPYISLQTDPVQIRNQFAEKCRCKTTENRSRTDIGSSKPEGSTGSKRLVPNSSKPLIFVMKCMQIWAIEFQINLIGNVIEFLNFDIIQPLSLAEYHSHGIVLAQKRREDYKHFLKGRIFEDPIGRIIALSKSVFLTFFEISNGQKCKTKKSIRSKISRSIMFQDKNFPNHLCKWDGVESIAHPFYFTRLFRKTPVRYLMRVVQIFESGFAAKSFRRL